LQGSFGGYIWLFCGYIGLFFGYAGLFFCRYAGPRKKSLAYPKALLKERQGERERGRERGRERMGLAKRALYIRKRALYIRQKGPAYPKARLSKALLSLCMSMRTSYLYMCFRV